MAGAGAGAGGCFAEGEVVDGEGEDAERADAADAPPAAMQLTHATPDILFRRIYSCQAAIRFGYLLI